MATIEEAIARLVFEFTSKGAEKVAADLKNVDQAQTDIAVSAEKTEKASLSLEKSFDNLERRFVSTVRAQQDYAAVQAKVNAAVAQNPALQDRANAVLDGAKAKYDALAKGGEGVTGAFAGVAKALGLNIEQGTKAAEIATLLEARELRLASSVGLVGEVLSVIGPAGVAAVAGIGAVIVGIDQLVGSANRMGDVAREIASFSTATGLSTDAVQALRSEGTKFGLSTEETGKFVEHFTYALEGAHTATGPLYDAIQKINPALAVQMALAKPGAESLNLLAQAYKQAGDQAQKLALVRAAGGRTAGAEAGEFLAGIAEKGSVAAVTDEVNRLDLITKEQVAHWKELSVQIEDASTTSKNNIASIFTGPVLEAELAFYNNLLSISRVLKGIGAGTGLERIFNTPSSFGPGEPVLLPGQGGKTNATPQFDTSRLNPFVQATNQFGGLGSEQPSFSGFDAANAGNAPDAEKIKAASEATAELIAKTDALTAAEKSYGDAQQTLNALQSLGIASESDLGSARKSAGDALAVLATVEKQRISELNGAATGAEILKQKTDELTAAMMQGKISAETYNRALHGDTANQVAALQDQRVVMEAIGGAAKMAAQYAADYNAALRGGKEPADALQIASEKLANSQATATAAVLKQVEALKDQNDMIKAQLNGTEKSTAAAIAYKNAIASGASEASAIALKTETAHGYTIKAAAAALEWQQNLFGASKAAGDLADRLKTVSGFESGDAAFARIQAQQGANFGRGGDFGNFSVSGMDNQDQGHSFSADPRLNVSYKGGGAGQRLDVGQNLIQFQQLNQQVQDDAKKYMDQFKANNDYVKAMVALTKATDANTAATSATLNPLYSQGHGALAIGYYKAAGGLDMMAQGPSSGDTVPFHAMVNGGERITITPPGKTSNDNSRQVINNNNFIFNNASTSNARRSQRQFAQGFGQIAAAGS